MPARPEGEDPRRVFAADVHLHPQGPDRTERFFDWLDREAPRSRVHLLGDLFDVWVGPRQAKRPFYRAMLDRLARAARRSAGMEFVHGNRDFQIGADFERDTGIRVFEDPASRRIAERRVLLTHGDLLCAADRAYQRTRRVLRSRPVRTASAAAPLWIVDGVAGLLRRTSRRAVARKSASVLEPSESAIRQFFDDGHDAIVCGHLHRAFHRSYATPAGEREMLCVGDWEDGGSFASLEEGRLRLFVLESGRWREVPRERADG